MRELIRLRLIESFGNSAAVDKAACEISSSLTTAGYGLLGFSGPSQLWLFESPAVTPAPEDCG